VFSVECQSAWLLALLRYLVGLYRAWCYHCSMQLISVHATNCESVTCTCESICCKWACPWSAVCLPSFSCPLPHQSFTCSFL